MTCWLQVFIADGNPLKSNVIRIGILGGAFDPIHKGHLVLAKAVSKEFSIDRFFFVPSFIPPVAGKSERVTPAAIRLAMVRAAIRGKKRWEVSEMEMSRGGISYTVDTIAEFRKKFPPPAELFFVVGADWEKRLREWKDFGRMLSMCRFIVAARPGYTLNGFSEGSALFNFKAVRISSSEIRHLIRGKKSVRRWVPSAVVTIIQKHGLYRE